MRMPNKALFVPTSHLTPAPAATRQPTAPVTHPGTSLRPVHCPALVSVVSYRSPEGRCVRWVRKWAWGCVGLGGGRGTGQCWVPGLAFLDTRKLCKPLPTHPQLASALGVGGAHGEGYGAVSLCRLPPALSCRKLSSSFLLQAGRGSRNTRPPSQPHTPPDPATLACVPSQTQTQPRPPTSSPWNT